MSLSFSYLPYSATHSFSRLVTDYLSQNSNTKPFFSFGTDKEGLRKAIEERKNYTVDRKKLSEVLNRQYAHLLKHEMVEKNLLLLQDENTFTVCTAHQPNLLTGYLYFIYKILHAVKLAEELKQIFPENNFVPVYYMGSEDNDLDELGTFRYNGKKIIWNGNGQTGAVGRMKTESLKELLETLFAEMGPPGEFCEELKSLITRAYLHHETIAQATQFLVNELFGKYGLIVLDPDSALLKASFANVMKDDLLHQTAHRIVSRQMEQLSEHYKVQAQPRAINLFYLRENVRERIEKRQETWHVVNTAIKFTEQEILQELETHPERFSPNVILRGLFQETILPNVAFIGGGSEMAYWLQLKTLFAHYSVFFPSVHLRQSVQWIFAREQKLRHQLELNIPDIFKSEQELIHQFVLQNSKDDWQTGADMKTIENALLQLKQKAVTIDPTLRAAAEAALAKMRHQAEVLEVKMLRAAKRKIQNDLSKITKLKSRLFPGDGLQERIENFISFYLLYGSAWFDRLKDNMQPFRHEFLVIEEE